jgi:hypothetical protein
VDDICGAFYLVALGIQLPCRGTLIHLLLVTALVVLVYNLVAGRSDV